MNNRRRELKHRRMLRGFLPCLLFVILLAGGCATRPTATPGNVFQQQNRELAVSLAAAEQQVALLERQLADLQQRHAELQEVSQPAPAEQARDAQVLAQLRERIEALRHLANTVSSEKEYLEHQLAEAREEADRLRKETGTRPRFDMSGIRRQLVHESGGQETYVIMDNQEVPFALLSVTLPPNEFSWFDDTSGGNVRWYWIPDDAGTAIRDNDGMLLHWKAGFGTAEESAGMPRSFHDLAHGMERKWPSPDFDDAPRGGNFAYLLEIAGSDDPGTRIFDRQVEIRKAGFFEKATLDAFQGIIQNTIAFLTLIGLAIIGALSTLLQAARKLPAAWRGGEAEVA